MSKTLTVNISENRKYDICIENSFDSLLSNLKDLGYKPDQKICIVTDSNVKPLYLDSLKGLLEEYFSTVIYFEIPAGEENKKLTFIEKLYEELIKAHFERRDILVAFGGGVVGDMTGFAAATYLRGIDFIQVPTTILSQVDSSVGGKTGVDFLNYKNMVGAFYQPTLVYMNLSLLNSLPKEQIVSGLGEVIKYGLIKNKDFYEWLKKNKNLILDLDYETLEYMIYVSCDTKRIVVENDEKEQGERALLNFGHTIGHAIEKMSDFKLPHGQCVGIGSIAAAYISVRQGLISSDSLDDIKTTLNNFNFPLYAENILPEQVLMATKSDKKMTGNKIKFILLKSVGNAFIYKDLTDEDILDGIKYVIKQV